MWGGGRPRPGVDGANHRTPVFVVQMCFREMLVAKHGPWVRQFPTNWCAHILNEIRLRFPDFFLVDLLLNPSFPYTESINMKITKTEETLAETPCSMPVFPPPHLSPSGVFCQLFSGVIESGTWNVITIRVAQTRSHRSRGCLNYRQNHINKALLYYFSNTVFHHIGLFSNERIVT